MKLGKPRAMEQASGEQQYSNPCYMDDGPAQTINSRAGSISQSQSSNPIFSARIQSWTSLSLPGPNRHGILRTIGKRYKQWRLFLSCSSAC